MRQNEDVLFPNRVIGDRSTVNAVRLRFVHVEWAKVMSRDPLREVGRVRLRVPCCSCANLFARGRLLSDEFGVVVNVVDGLVDVHNLKREAQ